jgi:hypothetical protein
MNQLMNEQGEVVPIISQQEWEKKRAKVLLAMQEVMGDLPGEEKHCQLDVKVEEEIDCGSYLRRLVSYSAEPESRVPAYLLIPKGALEGELARAVLCLHPTQLELGNKTVIGLGGKPNRAYAAELAERGFVTLAPAYPHLAEYWPDLKKLGYASGTMKAIWDNMRGIDLLESLPFVSGKKVGAIGHSLGGHNSIYTAVYDDRIGVIASSCGFDSYQDYMDGDLSGWHQERYMPRMKEYPLSQVPFDFYDMIAALAPRPCFISAPLRDSNFKWKSVSKIVEIASQVYDTYGVKNNLSVMHPDCEHDFPSDMREKAYLLFETHLTI